MGAISLNCHYFYSESDLALAVATSGAAITRMESFARYESPLELTVSRLRQPGTLQRGDAQFAINLVPSESIPRGQTEP
jgi:hypothetical protein